MAVIISGNGIDMGGNPVSNASQIDGVVINENGDNVATTSNLVGFKNYIINGGFDIDQRNNKVGILIPAGGYAFTADRWLVNNTTNQPVSITVSDFPTNSGGRTGRLRIKFDTAPTTGIVQISQKIENVSILGGKVVTLSHSFDCDAMTIGCDLTQNFGIGGSSNVVTGFSSINTTGILSSLTRFSSSITVPSIEGKSIGANSYTQITYNLPIRTTNIQTIAQVQLEEGSVATPFENRPYGLELSLCQRYYETGIARLDTYTAASSIFGYMVSFKQVKRLTPSLEILTPSYINAGSAATAVISKEAFLAYATSIGQSQSRFAFNYNASAEL